VFACDQFSNLLRCQKSLCAQTRASAWQFVIGAQTANHPSIEQLISRRAPTLAIELGRDFGVGTLLQQAIDFGDDLGFGLAQLPCSGRQLNSQDFGGATLEAYLRNDLGMFRTFSSPMMDAIHIMPFPQMQTLLDAAFPDGNQNYWNANRATSPLSGVTIEYYGGVASRVGVSETAFAQRQAQYDVAILAQWVDSGESQRHIGWARGLADSMRPFSSGAYFLNFLGEEGKDTIKAAFGPNYDQLTAIKKKYDPTNFFCMNQNIKPEV
jgi:Berberine and berberine like